MNQRFEGWKLGLALLLPAAIIAAAVWIGFQAVTDDDDDQAVGVVDPDPTATVPAVVPTEPPETQPVDEPTAADTPTPLPLPTPAPVPTATETPEATPTPTVAPTATAGPTTPPAPAPTADPNAPTPTPTVDPNVREITCASDAGFPTELTVGEQFGPLRAVTTPEDLAESLVFTWNFGNSRIAISPQTGLISYDQTGSYTVTVVGVDQTTNEEISATCGTVQVGTVVSALNVTCSVAPFNTAVKFEDATTADAMTVTVSWTPPDAVLTLQYEFEAIDPIVFAENVTSPDSMTHTFLNLNATFDIFWRHADSGETGTLRCPAFPALDPDAPTPTPVPDSIPTPVPTATPTVEPTATPIPTATPTA